MAVTLRIPAKIAELTEQERGGAEGDPNRYASARFVLQPTAKPEDAEHPAEDDEPDTD